MSTFKSHTTDCHNSNSTPRPFLQPDDRKKTGICLHSHAAWPLDGQIENLWHMPQQHQANAEHFKKTAAQLSSSGTETRSKDSKHMLLKLQSLLASACLGLWGAFESIVSMIFSHKLHATKKVRGKLSSNPVLPGLIPFLFAVAV